MNDSEFLRWLANLPVSPDSDNEDNDSNNNANENSTLGNTLSDSLCDGEDWTVIGTEV